MLQVLHAKLWRSKGRFCILLCILTLAMLFFSLSMQLYMQSVQSARIIEESTTTIAIPQGYYQQSPDGQVSKAAATADQLQQLHASRAVLNVHEGIAFSGYSGQIKTVVPAANQFNHSFSPHLTTENVAVLRIRCEQVLTDTQQPEVFSYYDVEARIVEALYLKEGLYLHKDVPLSISLCRFVDDDGRIPFEAGREYVVTGFYNPPLAQLHHNKLKGNFYGAPDPDNPYIACSLLLNFGVSIPGMPVDSRLVRQSSGGMVLFSRMAQDYPVVLPADDPRAEDMVQLAAFNSNLLLAAGVDTVDAVPYFAMEDAYITAGRDFTEEEVASGAKVCIISQTLAQKNGLQLGDALDLSLYDNHMAITSMMPGQESLSIAEMAGPRDPVQQTAYTIIGMYQSPEWYDNRFSFSPNTLFINESSITPSGGVKGLPFASSIVLQNGSNDQFRADLAAAGIPEEAYALYDGGYMEYMESLRLMQQDTRVMLVVCVFLFFVISLSALMMIALHLRQDTNTMVKIGASRSYAARYMLGCILPIVLLAAMISYGISCIIHVPMMDALEAWYAQEKPRYSVMLSSSGMLTDTVAPYPSPLGMLLSLLAVCCMTLALFHPDCERREKA